MLGVGRGLYYGPVESGTVPEDPTQQFEQQVGEFQKINSVLVDGGDRYGASAVTFDSAEELIWIGNQGGHVTSYYGGNLEKYTSFQVVNNQEIRQILTFDELILILSSTQLRGQIRRGLPVFNHESENFMDMQCMLQTSPTTVLFGGHQEYLVEFDLVRSQESRMAHVGESGCAILRNHGRYNCVGQPSGHIQLFDPRTLGPEQTVEAHSGSLSDFDVHGNLLVTCGFSSRHGNLSVDRFLKVYDLRVLRALAPIQISLDPFMLRFLPSFSSRIATVSPSGQMEISETQALTTTNIMLYQVTTSGSMCLAYDVSSSCHHLAFGDSNGYLHLFASNPTAMFNPYSRETEFADPLPALPPMELTDEMSSLTSIALPLLPSPLLSEWPADVLQPVYRKTPDVDRQVLQSMKMVGNIMYAPNPGTFRRNQMQYRANLGNQIPTIVPTDPSSPFGQAKSFSPIPSQHSPSHLASSPLPFLYGSPGMKTNVYTPKHHARPYYHGKFCIPKRYAKMDWKKSFFEEGDMESYNRTQFSGLEAITANSYCNSMIQVLYHFEYLRATLLNHLCKREACLSCELAFLFHMMDQSKCVPCSGSNFLRAFRVIPEASALGLILHESQSKKRSAFLRLIQNWNRFILHQIQTETSRIDSDKKGSNGNSLRSTPNPFFALGDSVSRIFSMKQENTNRCTRCGREEKKESEVLLSNLNYSFSATDGGRHCEFVKILQRSIAPEQTTPAWCDKCEKYPPTFQSRVPKALPPLLSLNTCLDNANDFATWKNYMQSLLSDKQPATEVPEFQPRVVPSAGPPPHVKPCRFANNCVRVDCKFWHEGRNQPVKDGEPGKSSDFDLNPEIQAKWLPRNIRIKIEDTNKVSVMDLDGENKDGGAVGECSLRCADYEIAAVVVFARDSENEEKCNLVSLIHVDKPYFNRKKQEEGKTEWFLFNDFCVREVAESESCSFNPKWKIPAVIFYRMKSLPEEFKLHETLQMITADVFKESNSKDSLKNKKVTYKPLGPDEIPKKGDAFCVAIDAEFVTLGQEETELRSDGKLATVKPQQLSVARITCVRGQGPLEGTPFIDDYISTQEVVVDYLTKFSGIQPGDLDANFSTKYVTGLKSVYLKLRFLVDCGVKFVGHGLNNDFKVINIQVPQDQVIDTVNLFYLPNQRRMVSLKFLAWHFLGMIIQAETHDSIEDARAALALYRKYVELQKTGQLEEALIDLYEAGKKAQWKVPNECDKKVT